MKGIIAQEAKIPNEADVKEKNGLSYFDRLLGDLYIVSNSSESEEVKMPERKNSNGLQ